MSFESSGNASSDTSLSLALPSVMRLSQNAALSMIAELRPGFDPDDVSFARFGVMCSSLGADGRGDFNVRFALEAVCVVSFVDGVHFAVDVTKVLSFDDGVFRALDGVEVLSSAATSTSDSHFAVSSGKTSSNRLRGRLDSRLDSGVVTGVVYS